MEAPGLRITIRLQIEAGQLWHRYVRWLVEIM